MLTNSPQFTRLRTEAMLLDAAAAGEEAQPRKLSALARKARMWRQAAKQLKASAAQEPTRGMTLQ